MASILKAVWENMSAPNSNLADEIEYESHAALCRIYEQRDAKKARDA